MKRIYSQQYADGNLSCSVNPDKKKLLDFMRKQDHVAVAAGYVNDVVTGENLVGKYLFAYQDGGYGWTSQDVYHFEKYDLELTPEFCAFALAR